MLQDRKHMVTRLEELRQQKYEMLRQRNEELRQHNSSYLTSMGTAESSTNIAAQRIAFEVHKPVKAELSQIDIGNASITSNAFFCKKQIASHSRNVVMS